MMRPRSSAALSAAISLCVAASAHGQVQQASLKAPAPIAPKAPATHYLSSGFAPGERVPDVAFLDVKGKKASLGLLSGATGAVLIVRDAECPVSQRYSPRMAELEKEY